jgi:hypothetical protein
MGDDTTIVMETIEGHLRFLEEPLPTLEKCSNNHTFLALNDHPKKEGHYRCPYCLAKILDLLEQQILLS